MQQAEHRAVLKLVLSKSSTRKLKLTSGPSYVPRAPAATPVPNKVEDEGKPVSTAAASPLMASSHLSHVSTLPETSNVPEEQKRTVAVASSPVDSSQVDLSTEPCMVYERSNHGTVETKEVVENGVNKQQASSWSERVQTEATGEDRLQEAFVVRAISASTNQSGQLDHRKVHHVRWHSPTKTKDLKPLSPLEVREKGDPQLSTNVGNGTFLTILPVEMSSRGSADHVKELKPCDPMLPVANSNEHKDHQQCSSAYQHVEPPPAVASQGKATKSVSKSTSSKPETSKDGRAKSDGTKEAKRCLYNNVLQ